VWGSSATTKLLRYHIPTELPEPNARGLHRPAGRIPALFSRLISCHCSATMTPNVKRGSYYCAAGRDSGATEHGTYNVTERSLRAVLEPEAARYMPGAHSTYKDGTTDAERTGLEARKARLQVDWDLMDATLWRTKMAAIDARLAEIARQTRTVDRLGVRDHVPAWSDVAGMNEHLRRIWTRVTLDAAMAPTVEWGIPAYMYDPDAAEERERAIEEENAKA
jgi:hypothetical protein